MAGHPDRTATFLKDLRIHAGMTKIHARAKRLLGITSFHRKHRFWFTTVTPKKGAKSFMSKEKAQEWAKEQGLDVKTHELRELQNGKKFQWRPLPRE